MKKSLTIFFCILLTYPVMADNYIKFKSTAIEDTINTMVPESHRMAAADEYQKQMDATTGKISVMGMYRVCAAAGFNINNTNGYNGCRLFINTIAEKSGFGSGSATQQTCKTKFNGIWTISPDGKEYQCVGKDGHKLVYNASCDGAGGECVKTFSKLQTQEPTAREFILAYGTQKNLPLTCYHTYENRRGITSPLGQEYIKCSAGGKSYEFEFDDLIQDPGKTAVESENTALCTMFGGKIVKHPDSSIEKIWQSCEIARDICNGPLQSLATKIGHSVMYQGYCRLSRSAQTKSLVGLKTLPGVDNRIFYNTGAQMRAGTAQAQVEEYLHTKFPNETYINCNPNPKILNAGLGLDPDYVMTCTVGTNQVDFIFHDLTEGADYKAESGEAKMACAIVAQRVDGKNCRGLDQSACTDLGNKLKQMGRRGTEYKPEQGGCILLDTQTEELVNLGLEIAGGVALTVATGGYGAIVVAASIATDLGFDLINKWLRRIPYSDYQEFMKHANKCSDSDTSIENQYCIADVLSNYYALIMGNLSDLAPEFQTLASEKLQSMARILSDDDIISTVSTDSIPLLKQSRNYISMAALGVILIINPDKLASKGDDLIRQATRMGKVIHTTGGKIDDILDATRILSRTNVDDINKIDDIADATIKIPAGKFRAPTNIDDIGMVDKGWERLTLENNSIFKTKTISYPGEADDVRRALENSNGNLAYLGVKDNQIIITYKSDMNRAQPMFNRYISGSNIDNAVDATRMFGRTNIDDIGMVDKGWERLTLENNSIFRTKTISYPGEADDVRRALENSNGNLAYLGVKDNQIIITYKSNLNHAQPMFNRYISGSNMDNAVQDIQNNRPLIDDLLAERQRAQQVPATSQTPTTPQQKSWLDIAREADDMGRQRIDAFRAKYDLSTQGRLKYTKQQWQDIFDREIGWSDLEDTFRDDFFRDYQSLLELNRY